MLIQKQISIQKKQFSSINFHIIQQIQIKIINRGQTRQMKTRSKSQPEVSQPKDKKKSQSKSIPPKQKTVPKKNVKTEKQPIKEEQKKVEEKKENSNELQEVVITNKSRDRQIKVKKVTQPKKYLNKNYQQISRIARSQYQKIYLLKAERNQQEEWNFVVQGASGSNYKVRVHHTALNCTCVDFRMKKKPCKHIYFIVTQVAQNLQILDYFNTTLKISKAAFKILDQQLTKRLHSRMNAKTETKNQDIDLKDDTDCTICFTQMDKTTQNLEGCSTCKKYFHFECLAAWKKHNPTCPLCRGHLTGVGSDKDPLGKLQGIQINTQKSD